MTDRRSVFDGFARARLDAINNLNVMRAQLDTLQRLCAAHQEGLARARASLRDSYPIGLAPTRPAANEILNSPSPDERELRSNRR